MTLGEERFRSASSTLSIRVLTADLGAEVTPDALNLGMHETPHHEEHADPGEYRGDHVLVYREQCTSEERRSAQRRSSELVKSPETLPGAAV